MADCDCGQCRDSRRGRLLQWLEGEPQAWGTVFLGAVIALLILAAVLAHV